MGQYKGFKFFQPNIQKRMDEDPLLMGQYKGFKFFQPNIQKRMDEDLVLMGQYKGFKFFQYNIQNKLKTPHQSQIKVARHLIHGRHTPMRPLAKKRHLITKHILHIFQLCIHTQHTHRISLRIPLIRSIVLRTVLHFRRTPLRIQHLHATH